LRELLARLRALLRRATELRPPKITVGDLILDTGEQSATRGGHAISLTHKEYALLEYLVRNAGRVVSRSDIAEHVWDETFDPFSNLIEVYINRLRRKIDPDGSAELLQTRRGAGYILRAGSDAETAGRARAASGQGKSTALERKKHV
jgi:two-component system, OmpR family, copper resistance phosphate regulon response regulator CusR